MTTRITSRSTTRRALAVLLCTAALVAASCTAAPPAKPVTHSGGTNPDDAPRGGVAAYSDFGPLDVGVMTVEIEPGRQMEVWYPADHDGVAGHTPEAYHIRDFVAPALRALLSPTVDPIFDTVAYRDVPATSGPARPLVLFSHGFMGFRLQSTELTTHLASWGFVVISPDYFERGLQSFFGENLPPSRSTDAVTRLAMTKAVELDTSGPLAGDIDTTRLFPVGHSAGGSQSTQLAGTRTDVQSWISLAAGISVTPSIFNPAPKVPPALTDPDKTAMWMVGENDHVASVPGVQDAYDYTAGERKLVVIPGAGHNNAFSDLCEIGRDQGGLIGLAQSGGLPLPDFVINLARDGCVAPPNFFGAQVWPVVDHFVTAELRYRSGLDPEPVGLGEQVVDKFGPVVPTYRHDE